jgi:predicted MFS family arabinose efflux permease
MAVFASGALVGAGLGIGAGASVGHHFGWRAAFLMAGTPALLVAVLAYALREPLKGATEDVPNAPAAATPPLRTLLRIPTFWIICIGMTLQTGATGAFLHWGPKFLEIVRGLSQEQAGVFGGSVAVVACLLGVGVSGLVTPRLERRTAVALPLVIAAGLLLAAPGLAVFVILDAPAASLAGLAAGAFALSLVAPPMGALVYSLVEPRLRATALAVFILVTHIGGDGLSPTIIGLLDDAMRAARVSAAEALRLALFALPVLCLLGGIVSLLALRTYRADVAAMQSRLSAAAATGAHRATHDERRATDDGHERH